MGGLSGKNENLMHLALNMSHNVYGLLLIYPSGDISLMCYIAMNSSWGKWYLQTIHGFTSTCSSIEFATDDRARKRQVFFTFVLENHFIFIVFWWKMSSDIQNVQSLRYISRYLFWPTFCILTVDIFVFFLIYLHRLKGRRSLRS